MLPLITAIVCPYNRSRTCVADVADERAAVRCAGRALQVCRPHDVVHVAALACSRPGRGESDRSPSRPPGDHGMQSPLADDQLGTMGTDVGPQLTRLPTSSHTSRGLPYMQIVHLPCQARWLHR